MVEALLCLLLELSRGSEPAPPPSDPAPSREAPTERARHRAYVESAFVLKGLYDSTRVDSGKPYPVATRQAALGGSGWIRLKGDWYLVPGAWLSFSRTLGDDAGRSRLAEVRAELTWVWDSLDFHAGPRFLGETWEGAGGSAVLRDGASSTTFSRPGSTRVALLWMLGAGAGFEVWRARFGLDAAMSGFLSKRRTANVVFSAGFGVW